LPPAFKTTAHSNPSIYGEIGPGERIALSKLAIEKFEETGRPLRIAIDVSIWQFQTQAGQGGSNPAIRTFYYRLQRLISTSIQAVFIFDGPHKPPFKRNKRTGQNGAVVPNLLTKQLLKLFGFPFYMAPGEAEAECALLQREGIVDAVLSEDVDTLMFGCGRTLRNWSSEGSRGNKSPTHVSVYDAKATKEGRSGLDREGMVLIALMSGGDYITEGIPGCGIKVACEAARAGYGKSLCQILRSDTAGMEAWRQNIAHEIRTSTSESSTRRCKFQMGSQTERCWDTTRTLLSLPHLRSRS
jgi:Holliday junction resolvase YEN1